MNVAEGTQDSDAVNLSQLKGVTTALGGGSQVNSDGSVKAPSYVINGKTYTDVGSALAATNAGTTDALAVHYDAADKAKVTLGGTDGTTLTGLKDGSVASGSKDAVTGNQLFATNQAVNTVTNNVTNLTNVVDGLTDDALQWDSEQSAFSAKHGDAATSRIANVADAVDDNDAVNKQQLDAVASKVGDIAPKLKYIKFGLSSSADAQASGTNSLAIGGNAFAKSDGSVAIGTNASAGGLNSVAVGLGSSATDANTFAVGSRTSLRRIVNVAEGTALTDAATVGQVGKMIDAKFAPAVQANTLLKSTSLRAGLLGATSSLPPDQLIASGPTDKGGQIQADGIDSIAIGLNTHATNDNAAAIGTGVSAAAKEAIAIGYNNAASEYAAVAIGSSVDALAEGAVAIGNGGTNVQGKNSVGIGRYVAIGDTAEGAVAIGNNIIATGKNSVTLGADSMDDGAANVVSVGSSVLKRKIVNVAAGTSNTDAVNVSQLKSVAAAIGGGSAVGTDGLVTLPTYKINGTDTKGTLADGISALDTRISNIPGASDALLWDTTNSVYTAKHGGTNAKIANLAAGTADNDAVNFSQLKGTAQSVADALGGGSTLDPDTGKISEPTYTVDGEDKTNVGDAITALDGGLKEAKDGIDGLSADLANAVKYDADDHAKVTFDGAAGTTLDNVAAGVISSTSKQAINGSQLYATNKAISDVLGGEGGGLNTDGTIKKPTFTVGDEDKATIGDAIAALDAKTTDITTDALMWDTDAYSAKHSGTNAKIKNLAAGTVDNDAVNVSQLKGVTAALGGGAAVGTDGAITAPTYTIGDKTYDNVSDALAAAAATGGSVDALNWDATNSVYTAKYGDTNAKIANLANGTADNDAVNFSQLKGTAQSVADALGGGSTLDPATGKISEPTYTVDGEDKTNVGDAITALDGGLKEAKDGIDGLNGEMADVKDGIDGLSVDLANAVKYDADDHATVTLDGAEFDSATNEGGTKLTNVAVGTEDSDAVNLKQLKDAGLFDEDGNTLNAVVYDNDAKDAVTFGGATGTLLDNVAAGTVSSTSKQAINGSQLYNTAQSIADVLGGTDGGLNEDGTIKAPTYTIGDKTYDNVGDAIEAAAATGGSVDALKWNDTAGAYDAAHGDETASRVTNVADATEAGDAVNLKQLTEMGLVDPDTGTVLDAVVYDKGTEKAKVTFGGATGTTLDNVAAGTVSSNSKQAINGSQLYGTAQSVAEALGSSVDENGKVKKPKYTVGGSEAAGVDGAIAALDSRISNASTDALKWDSVVGAYSASHTGSQTNRIINVADGVAATDAINKGQLDEAVKPITEIAPKLKYIKFGATEAADAQANGTNSLAIGGNAFAKVNGALAIGANASAGGVNSVAIGLGSSATEDNTVAVGNRTSLRRIVNVAKGTALTDAATVGQVGEMIDAKFAPAIQANSLLKSTSLRAGLLGATSSLPPDQLIASGPTDKSGQIQAEGTDSIAIGLNTHATNDNAAAIGTGVSAAAKEAVAVGYSAAASEKSAVAIGSSVDALAEGAVAIGNGGTSVQGKNSVGIGHYIAIGDQAEGAVAIGNNILAMGKNSVTLGTDSTDDGVANVVSVGSSELKRKIVNVAAGTGLTDAVNVSQLKSAAAAIGGGSTVGTDGLVTLPTYKIDGKDTTGSLADGISKLDQRITEGGGGGGGVDALKWDADAEMFSAAHGDSATNVITNVADGLVEAGSTDAVTGSQLFGVADSVAAALGGGSEVNKDGTITAPEYTVGGETVTGVGEAVGALDDRITNVAGDVTNIAGDVATITNNYTQLAGDALKWDANATGGAAYSAAHGDAKTASRITNVADATQASDAINKGQFDKAITDISTKADPLSVKYDGADKTSVTLGGKNEDGTLNAPVKLTNVAAGTGDTDAVNYKQFKDAGLVDPSGKALDAVVYDANSAKASVTFGGANGTILNNVADGLVTQDSRQAVNGGQLYQLKDQLSQQITNLDGRVTNIENNGGGGSAPFISANPTAASIDNPTPANAGDTAGIAVGYSASASGDQASAMGDHAVAQAKDSVALGNGSTVTETATNSVALGNNSVADTANTVSIGSAGNERTLSHVARGNADTDAATMGQMRETLSQANAYTDTRLNDVWQGLGEEIDEVNRQANRGIAAASALINVTPYVPGHTTVNAGVASYRGETALGVGVSRWSDNGRVNLNAGVSAAQNDEPVFRVGVGYIF